MLLLEIVNKNFHPTLVTPICIFFLSRYVIYLNSAAPNTSNRFLHLTINTVCSFTVGFGGQSPNLITLMFWICCYLQTADSSISHLRSISNPPSLKTSRLPPQPQSSPVKIHDSLCLCCILSLYDKTCISNLL